MRHLRRVLAYPLACLAIAVIAITLIALWCERSHPASEPPLKGWEDHPEAYMGPSVKDVVDDHNRRGMASPADVLEP